MTTNHRAPRPLRLTPAGRWVAAALALLAVPALLPHLERRDGLGLLVFVGGIAFGFRLMFRGAGAR